jgi:hypothetical protein
VRAGGLACGRAGVRAAAPAGSREGGLPWLPCGLVSSVRYRVCRAGGFVCIDPKIMRLGHGGDTRGLCWWWARNSRARGRCGDAVVSSTTRRPACLPTAGSTGATSRTNTRTMRANTRTFMRTRVRKPHEEGRRCHLLVLMLLVGWFLVLGYFFLEKCCVENAASGPMKIDN